MTEGRGAKLPLAAPVPLARQAGLTLFELVVFILVVAIIFANAFNRFREYPGAAERANFMAITTQLRTGVKLQMMHGIASGSWDELEELEDTNPMHLMLETPENYIGEFSFVDPSMLPRRSWYFDRQKGELVYLANDSSRLYEVRGGEQIPTDSVRFRITMVYGDEESRRENDPSAGVTDSSSGQAVTGPASALAAERDRGDWQGLTLEAVRPYVWESINLEVAN